MRKGPQGRIAQFASKRGGVPIGRGTKARVAGILGNQRPTETRIVTTGWSFPESEGRSIPMLTRSESLEGLSHKLNLVLNIKED